MKRLLLVLFALSSFNSKGVIHQIGVWDGYYQFVPSNIAIQLGDTIQWKPYFGVLPLMLHTITSNNIPAGAAPFDQVWQMPADTFFQYVPQVAGLYQYVCTPHITFGMIGEFTVTNGFTAQTYVPDDNFEQALINLGYDAVLDDSVTTANINTVTNLDVNSLNISDLTGIEDFTALTRLDCEQNKLITLDLSQNIALNYLDIDANTLTSLDVSSNTALTFLECADNQLTSLDLSLNVALTEFYCENNLLTSLDFRNGNNTLVVDFSTIGNPNLTCINADDAAYSTANWTNIDAQTSFNEDCSSVVGIKQYTSSKTLTKTFNIMGRETTFKPNTLLINVYDDGSAEKVFTKGTLNN